VSNLGDPHTQNFFWNTSPPAPGLPGVDRPLKNYWHNIDVAHRVCREAFGSSTIFAIGGADLFEHVCSSPLDNDQWYLAGGQWQLDRLGRDVFIKGLDCKCP
jgi:hypothetical protein